MDSNHRFAHAFIEEFMKLSFKKFYVELTYIFKSFLINSKKKCGIRNNI